MPPLAFERRKQSQTTNDKIENTIAPATRQQSSRDKFDDDEIKERRNIVVVPIDDAQFDLRCDNDDDDEEYEIRD